MPERPGYRHAGCGWPNGPADAARILALPSPDLLMLASEHWHYDRAVRAGKRVLWRAVPRVGFRPAEVGWSVARSVSEVLRHTDEVAEPIRDFVPFNELDLNGERGDAEDDWQGLDRRYALLGGFLFSVLSVLKDRLPGARLHFPAWTPDHGALVHVARWRPAAEVATVVDFHAYDSLDRIQAQYQAYRQAFPDRPLALTEWHCRGDLDEERRVLGWLAEATRENPLFEAAYFFIWRWHSAPGWWSDAWDVEHNPERYALFRDPPVAAEAPPTPAPSPPPEPEPEPAMTEYERFCRAEAARRGIDPEVAVRVANAEGGLTEPARVGRFPTGWSFWAFQLHYGGPGYERFGTVAGMGNEFTAATGWQPGDPAAWRDAMRWALDRAKWSGWGPWYGAAAAGVGTWDGIDRTFLWTVTPAEEWDYRQQRPPAPAPAPVPAYDPAYQAFAQNDDWSCAPTALRWALHALGRRPTEAWIEQAMLDQRVVSRELGLLDATGAGLAAFVRREYGEFGYTAEHVDPAAFEQAAGEAAAGRYPLLVGGRRWNHWSGVRGYEAGRGVLLLANPSEGWGGVGQELDRAAWERLGPFSLVRVRHETMPVVEVTAPAPVPAPGEELVALRARVAELEAERARLIDGLAVAGDDYADQLQALVDALRALRVERVGPRPAA